MEDLRSLSDGEKYKDCMVIIVNRMNLIKKYLEDRENLKDDKIAITIEFMCLQYRKIFENIIFASLAANRQAVTTQYIQLLNEYHPDRIIKKMKLLNPHYYPVPIKVIRADGGTLVNAIPISDKHLSEQDLKSAWNLCSDYLHARNPYAASLTKKTVLDRFQTWWDKIQNLLHTHCIKLKERNLLFICDVPFHDVLMVRASLLQMSHIVE